MSHLPYRARYSPPRVPEVIEDILPAQAAAVQAFGDLPGATLFPEEKTFIAKAVDKRRREFTTARGCARAALAALGLPPAPIVPGPRGAPQWPTGVVGSITHCAGYCAWALARTAVPAHRSLAGL
jgi:4'-phosphopantetheinyl transferase EntD